MWSTWFLWRWLISRLARAHGFLDPAELAARLHQFAHPAGVGEPIELLRAGVVFHARGLINTRAIQYNLDWDWPHWVRRQFNPHDPAFVPRGFSITHVNLTHRNWTAAGLPGLAAYPIVDPRGLLTPHFDGWSIDAALLAAGGEASAHHHLPSESVATEQQLNLAGPDRQLEIATVQTFPAGRITRRVAVVVDEFEGETQPICRMDVHVEIFARPGARCVPAVTIRPANPEGASFIRAIDVRDAGSRWEIHPDGHRLHVITMHPPPSSVQLSDYRHGDVLQRWTGKPDPGLDCSVKCEVGLATGLAAWSPGPAGATAATPRSCRIRIDAPLPPPPPLVRRTRRGLRRLTPRRRGGRLTSSDSSRFGDVGSARVMSWTDALDESAGCQLTLPDRKWSRLFRIAHRTLVLLTPNDVYPGPYTYQRFWFRDAAFMIHALLALGHVDRAKQAIANFFDRQTVSGYFKSQEGEWDSNGEVLWIIERYRQISGEQLPEAWIAGVRRGAKWIIHKRLADAPADGSPGSPHAGLMPAGFSAEHLGPNDYYYWDAFWSVAGLQAASDLMRSADDEGAAGRFAHEAERTSAAIERSVAATPAVRAGRGVPASPYRRMDAGAIGSIISGYPLQLWAADDARLLQTLDYLHRRCLVGGGFFQDMIHSGVNPYLTLHLAQNLLRSGDARWFDLVRTIADLASPTGQWPEAIHPRTGGGCMGDGQHGWAAAEWIMMMRNIFVDEEGLDTLVIGRGLDQVLDKDDANASVGPLPTRYGTVRVDAERHDEMITLRWHADWTNPPRRLVIQIGRTTHAPAVAASGEYTCVCSSAHEDGSPARRARERAGPTSAASSASMGMTSGDDPITLAPPPRPR